MQEALRKIIDMLLLDRISLHRGQHMFVELICLPPLVIGPWALTDYYINRLDVTSRFPTFPKDDYINNTYHIYSFQAVKHSCGSSSVLKSLLKRA